MALGCQQNRSIYYFGEDTPIFDTHEVFSGERFPNIVTAMDGSLVASWGNQCFKVRRSTDGGKNWGPLIEVVCPGFHGGGMIVDENSGDILAFVEEHHPISTVFMYRSKDHGESWAKEPFIIQPDKYGNVPSMHMNERGITLKYGKHRGRLIRASRYYGEGNDRMYWDQHYTNAIYSDDGGKTWFTSDPFPVLGTGEAAIEEMRDGRLYYNSRRHHSTDGLNPRVRYTAWSDDGGLTWKDMELCNPLPDGDQSRDYGLMAGMVRLPLETHDILLFSNIDSNEGRKGGTVWVSFDCAKSWPHKRLIESGAFAYSSMTSGRKGTASEGIIYLMYEGTENNVSKGYVLRFNMAWLLSGSEFLQ
ncbi:MAG: exo-alpha-sialidase [Cyclobacteriaceae bacterium]|nr:exo-alpha-sialidase [Cyclobacteriaceae bacterium]